jgi:hypothetical protein
MVVGADLGNQYPDDPPSRRPAHPYQIARKIEDLCLDAQAIDSPRKREIAIAVTHMETAAMWLNKAHYAAKKDSR